MPPRIVVTHRVHAQVIERLEPHGELVLNQTSHTLDPDTLAQRMTEATAMMAFMPDCVDEAFLRKAPRLKIVAGALKGFDNFDVQACTRRKVWLSNVPDLLTVPTAELAVTLMLCLARNVLAGDRYVRSGAFAGWRPTLYGQGMDGHTVGIIGMGAVGRVIARRLQGFDVTIRYADPQPLPADQADQLGAVRTDLETLLTESDYVLVAAPLNDATHHMLDEKTLPLMKEGAFLINVGRGSVVDEKAICEALETGRLAGYAADVFEMEDWALDARPRYIAPRLLSACQKTVFTPHLGSAVDDVRCEIALAAARNIIDVLEGRRPRGAVNRV